MSATAVAHGALLQGWELLAAASPSPSPSVQEIPPEDQTSPGLLGFLVTFAAALAVMLLAYSLVRRLRRVERRGQQREAAERESSGPAAAAGPAAPAEGPGPDGAGAPGAAPGPDDGDR